MVDTPPDHPATQLDVGDGANAAPPRPEISELRWKEIQLEQANRSLEEFAISIAHDLKNPIATIRGFAELLPQIIGTDVPAVARELLDRLIANADRAVAMIDDLLEYARFARPYDERAPVVLPDVLTWVEAMLDEDIRTTNATISRGSLPQIHGNATALRQVFLNLISNSIKYADTDRAPVVTIEGAPGPAQGMVTIRVSDNGRGIPKEARDTVFQLGWRGEDTSAVEGLGIGLAVCRVIIANHGGAIQADEGPDGIGTTISIVLPGSRDAPAQEDGSGLR